MIELVTLIRYSVNQVCHRHFFNVYGKSNRVEDADCARLATLERYLVEHREKKTIVARTIVPTATEENKSKSTASSIFLFIAAPLNDGLFQIVQNPSLHIGHHDY